MKKILLFIVFSLNFFVSYSQTANDYYDRGNAKQELKEYKAAITDYDKAIELNPNFTEAYSKRGNVKSLLQEYKEAILDYDKAIELNPNYYKAYSNRAVAKQELKEYKEAIADFDKAIELNPKYALFYSNRGDLKQILKECKDAITDYDKAIELDPKYTQAYIHRGDLKQGLKEYKDALTDYDKAIELNPNRSGSYNNRGNVKQELQEYKSALADYDKAIELNPNFTEAYNNRGNAKYNLQEYKNAIADYDKAIELNPNFTEAYNSKDIATKKVQEYKDSVAVLDKAIELSPNNISEVESNDYKSAIDPYNQFDNFILFTEDFGDVRITFGTNKSFITCKEMKNHPYKASLSTGFSGDRDITFKLNEDVIVVKTNDLLHNAFRYLYLSSNKGDSKYELDPDNDKQNIIETLVEFINPEVNKLLFDKNAVFEISRSQAIRFNGFNATIWMKTNDGTSVKFTMNMDGLLYSEKDKTGNRVILDIVKYENKQLTFKHVDKLRKINKTLTLSNIAD